MPPKPLKPQKKALPPRYVILAHVRPDDPMWTVTCLAHNDLVGLMSTVTAMRETGIDARPFELVPVEEQQ